jgi:hypothetical protein
MSRTVILVGGRRSAQSFRQTCDEPDRTHRAGPEAATAATPLAASPTAGGRRLPCRTRGSFRTGAGGHAERAAWRTAWAAVQGGIQAGIRGRPLDAVDLLAIESLEDGRNVAPEAAPAPRVAAAPLPRTC